MVAELTVLPLAAIILAANLTAAGTQGATPTIRPARHRRHERRRPRGGLFPCGAATMSMGGVFMMGADRTDTKSNQ
jgi:hypothetical protein